MRNIGKKIMVSMGLSQITTSDIALWKMHREVDMLYFALYKANYKARKAAVEALQSLHITAAIPQLLSVCKNDLKPVGLAALKAIKALDVNGEHMSAIAKLERFWYWKCNRKEWRSSDKYVVSDWYDKGSLTRLDKAKRKLTQPVRWGNISV